MSENNNESLSKKANRLIKRKCKYTGCKKMVINEESVLNTKEYKICCDLHNKIIKKYEKPDECPICSEEFDLVDNIPLIPCLHWICKKCIINSGKNECPICRQEVDLSKTETKQCNKVSIKRQKEKEEQQMLEDRRMAEQLQRDLNINERIHVQPVIVRRMPVINVENIEEMLLVIDALEDPVEQDHLRRYLLNMLRLAEVQIEENNEEEDEVD